MLTYNQNKQFFELFHVHCWFYCLGVCDEATILKSNNQTRFYKRFHERCQYIQWHVACNSGENMHFLTGFVTDTCLCFPNLSSQSRVISSNFSWLSLFLFSHYLRKYKTFLGYLLCGCFQNIYDNGCRTEFWGTPFSMLFCLTKLLLTIIL